MVTYDHIFKIILIGDNAVGKSSFIRRLVHIMMSPQIWTSPNFVPPGSIGLLLKYMDFSPPHKTVLGM